MVENDLISIIVPVYNAEEFIDKCVFSIMNQSYSMIEIILVDDGSTDKSLSKMLKLATLDSRIKVFSQQNGGPNAARRTGIIKASGKYVMFVDSDDYIDPSMCETLKDEIKEENIEIAVASWTVLTVDGKEKEYKNKYEGVYDGRFIAENVIRTNIFFEYNLIHTLVGKLFSRQLLLPILEKIDKRIKFTEDVPCFMLACLDARKIVIINKPLYYVSYNLNSLTRQHNKSVLNDMRLLFWYMKRELRERNAKKIMFKEMEYLVIRSLITNGYADAFGKFEYLYPYKKVILNSNIIVYGGGVFGNELVSYICSSGKYNLVAWVDASFESLRGKGMLVIPPSDISSFEYDFIVVAVINPKVVLEIKEQLIRNGISKKKIMTMEQIDVDINMVF